ncbi:MAG: hypothetical protein A2479_03995 [Candidatus Magasanikbacteria bacterium RIFOXYC2_FULL_39_8]|nr:MAG: hypothetical protein A2479_03995 [Candidatus Magasanikbacteria bacterium RIFOXYC2_FULL_39_8]
MFSGIVKTTYANKLVQVISIYFARSCIWEEGYFLVIEQNLERSFEDKRCVQEEPWFFVVQNDFLY